ncbi:NAD-dependent epimerase/dehydratase family protein [Ningiella sp. W23]|uniref:NAD-dependent epimerase/dehydratase family protein n=1 Tax=Ningiella sp. W23 TaxID=3023715 RepID=UPI003757250B
MASQARTNRKVSIIGLGWLGLPLAEHYLLSGYRVLGTTRSRDKCATLQKRGLEAYQFDIYNAHLKQQLPRSFFEQSTLVINIAIGRRDIDAEQYIKRITNLIDLAFERNAEQLIFVSTTSVFSQTSHIYPIQLDEDSPTDPASNSGKAHASIERYLLHRYADKSAILRLAGLIGPSSAGGASFRHPIYVLSQREQINGGNEAVNLVHQADALSFIKAIINQQATGRVFHACATEHPSRIDCYTHAADVLKLPRPKFTDKSGTLCGKVIDGQKSLNSLSLSLAYPSPYDMLRSPFD